MFKCPTEYYETKRQIEEEKEEYSLVSFNDLCEKVQREIIMSVVFCLVLGQNFIWSYGNKCVKSLRLEDIDEESLYDDSTTRVLQLLYKGKIDQATQLAVGVRNKIMYDNIRQYFVQFNRAPDGYDIDTESLSIVKIGK